LDFEQKENTTRLFLLFDRISALSSDKKNELQPSCMRLTHAYAHWLADVHLAGFAPAFTLSFHDSERSRKPPNAHSLGRYV